MELLRGRGRPVLIFALAFAAALAVLVGFAVWFVTATPGERHRGPLPPLDADARRLAENLKKHVVAVASEEHNFAYPEALERSARYIEKTLSGFGYTVSRDEFETEDIKVRNLEVSRAGPGSDKPRLVVRNNPAGDLTEKRETLTDINSGRKRRQEFMKRVDPLGFPRRDPGIRAHPEHLVTPILLVVRIRTQAEYGYAPDKCERRSIPAQDSNVFDCVLI